jgi:hypothetical protein
LQLAIDSEFFHCSFANPYTMYNKRRSRSGVRLTAQLAIRCLIANWRWHCNFKGLSQDRGWADFSRNLQASLSLMTYRMSLISAGSISMESTFKARLS